MLTFPEVALLVSSIVLVSIVSGIYVLWLVYRRRHRHFDGQWDGHGIDVPSQDRQWPGHGADVSPLAARVDQVRHGHWHGKPHGSRGSLRKFGLIALARSGLRRMPYFRRYMDDSVVDSRQDDNRIA